MNVILDEYAQAIYLMPHELIEGLNRPFPTELLAICVLCNHLDHQHGDRHEFACRCCRTAIKGAPLPVRFEARASTQFRLYDGVHVLVR